MTDWERDDFGRICDRRWIIYDLKVMAMILVAALVGAAFVWGCEQ